jgi:hypothetical protein
VELAADAVAAELAHHREAVPLGVALDGGADVTEPRAGAHLPDAEPHAFVRDLDQAARLDARLADEEHPAAVAVEAVLDHGDVYIQDVALLQHALARHAVAHLVVDRGADRLRERPVPRRRVVERRRHALLHPDHVLVAQVVQPAGADAGAHVRRDVVEHFGGEAPRHAHALHVLARLQHYGH